MRSLTPLLYVHLQVLCGYDVEEIQSAMARASFESPIVSLYYMLLEQASRTRSESDLASATAAGRGREDCPAQGGSPSQVRRQHSTISRQITASEVRCGGSVCEGMCKADGEGAGTGSSSRPPSSLGAQSTDDDCGAEEWVTRLCADPAGQSDGVCALPPSVLGIYASSFAGG